MAASASKPEFPKSPPVFGPGIWLCMHTLAIDATDDLSVDEFIRWVHKILYRLPCPDCLRHAADYLSSHPIEPFRYSTDGNGKRIGMFIWSWLFHNHVNERLKKEIFSFTDAYNMYLPQYTPDNVHTIEISSGEGGEVCGIKSV